MFNNSERSPGLNECSWLDVVVAHLRERDLDVKITQESVATRDAVLTISTRSEEHTLTAEFKSKASPAMVAALATATTTTEHRVLLITEHLTTATVQACRSMGLACTDLDGNMSLRLGAVQIEVEGRPRRLSKDLAPAQSASSQLMTRSGVQVLFVLLSDPTTVNLPMRDLGRASGTALGSVSAIFRELAAENYLSTRDNGLRHLHRTAHLLDRWVEGYRLRLHLKLTLGSYETDTVRWWTSADAAIRNARGQWGGETAAWHMDRHLLPSRGVVYAHDTPIRLLADFRMRKTSMSAASVAIRRKFWHVAAWDESITVPSPLVYADLLASDDPRQTEAALRLRMTDELLRRLE